MELGGRWKFDGEGKVEVRLVWEDTGVAVTSGMDWQVASTKDDGTWGAVLEKIPAGGLYRQETRLRVAPPRRPPGGSLGAGGRCGLLRGKVIQPVMGGAHMRTRWSWACICFAIVSDGRWRRIR